MEWSKIGAAIIARWSAILLLFIFILPILADTWISGALKGNTVLYHHPEEVDVSTDYSYMQAGNDMHTFLLDVDEIIPLQASPEVILQESGYEAQADTQDIGVGVREILMEAPEQVENGQVIGRVRVPTAGLSDTLAVGTSLNGAQKVLETSAAMICYDFMGLPERASVSVVGGHNYMEFNKLKDVKIGDDLILELDWGVYEYTIYDILIQSTLSSAPQGHLVIYT